MIVSPKVFLFTTVAALVGGASKYAAADIVDDWSTLPWDDLEGTLSEHATLFKSDNPVATYKAECMPEFTKKYSDRTNHNLINQRSGLCTDQLFCSFRSCNPYQDFKTPNVIEESVDAPGAYVTLGYKEGDNLPVNQNQMDRMLSDDNPSWNIPNYVLHPATASDVVSAVNFAKEHGLEVSVKNSGHSYQGASTKRDTLHLNMNKYKLYSNSTSGIEVCPEESVDDSEPFETDLSDQPCRLTRARGKNGVLRVGGGENFDKAYRAIDAWNQAQDSQNKFQFHMVGGGAGTVSPMGWTFQGGLADQMAASMYGLGVDQVIQIEVVLPSGQHVKFGPTEWEDSDGYYYPKTLAVSGVCRQNPEKEDEDKWIWEECEDDIPFDDLWFATRGGGGGTFGVITSMTVQLHDYLPLEFTNPQSACVPDEVAQRSNMGVGDSPYLNDVHSPPFPQYIADPLLDYQRFAIDYMHNPTSLGISADDAYNCSGINWCYGTNSSESLLTAWRTYIRSRSDILVQAGVNASTIDAMTSGCSENAVTKMDSYANVIKITDGDHKGKLQDNPRPTYESQSDSFNILVPVKYYLEHPQEAREQFPLYYTSFNKRTKHTSDQANALSEAHREAGNMAVTMPMEYFNDKFYSELFPKVFDTTDPENFPGFIGSNHAGAHIRGPTKGDWTKACPLDWSQEERDDKCIPLQETIYGTKRLRRLESIKEAIDPNYMFDCMGCIGNNRVKKEATTTSSSLRGTIGEESAIY